MSVVEIFTMIATGAPGALIVMAMGCGLVAIALMRKAR